MQLTSRLAVVAVLLLFCPPANAGQTNAPALMGTLGLNTVPNARMDKAGTMRLSLSTIDPYLHATIGLQITEPLCIAVRQSAEISDINGAADRLLPGLDLKLRLIKESAYRPEIALGLQSAIGHKRMAGEYIALSKRHKNFDVTAGMAWGRLGSAAYIGNPLKMLHVHFGKTRLLDGENPNGPENWFTGKDIGLFAGIEYNLPQIKNLSLKADWGADRYIIEQTLSDFKPPKPWSLGFSYTPSSWLNLGAAIIGGEKLMGQISLQAPAQQWPGRPHKKDGPSPLRPYRTSLALPDETENFAQREGIRLYETRTNGNNASTTMLLAPHRNTPLQLGRAARHIANHAGERAEELRITPLSYGLAGREIVIWRSGFERAAARHHGSPQEIWRDINMRSKPEERGLLRDRFNRFKWRRFRLALDNKISLSEEDSGLLYRTGLIIGETRRLTERIWTGGELRIDLHDNLHRLRDFRRRNILPVRSNIDDFAARTFSIDRTWIGWMNTPKPDLHISLTAGWLEEMYAGGGGEILWRPFKKTFALGAETYQVFKRSPFADMNLGLSGDRLLTGHIQGWYEFPRSNITLQMRAGRYLAEDWGGTLTLQRTLDNGAKMEAFVTATNAADIDPFGNLTHLYSGLKLTLPLGNIKHLPEGSELRLTAAPFARDAGQSLDPPLKLYEISEPLSYRHITRHWTKVVD